MLTETRRDAVIMNPRTKIGKFLGFWPQPKTILEMVQIGPFGTIFGSDKGGEPFEPHFVHFTQVFVKFGPKMEETEGLDDGIRWGAESIVKNTVLEAQAHGDTRRAMNNDDGFGWGAESIVKNTVLEAHAHGDAPRRSDNESGGWWLLPPRQGHTVGKQ